MVLKMMSNSLLVLAIFFTAFLASETSSASARMDGTGYYGGMQQCPYPTRIGREAFSMSDEEKEERREIVKRKKELKLRKLEVARAEKQREFAGAKLERFFEGSVAEFLTGVHIEKLNKCENYKVHPSLKCFAKADDKGTSTAGEADEKGKEVAKENLSKCGEKDDVPDLLAKSWIKSDADGGGGYCAANNDSSKGSINPAICSDSKLRPESDRKNKSYSISDCTKALKDYRKFRIEQGNAQAKYDRAKDEIEDREFAASNARERAALDRKYKMEDTEGDCEDCDEESRGYSFKKPKRDWPSIIGQVGLGLGLGFLGKKYDDRNAEYQAQLGYPPTQGYPTAVSMGLPFILGGVYGAMNGGTGAGGFGCGGNTYGGGGANGVYGPFGANGGAFGYPQKMYGAPWGGGMYNPGIGAYGEFNGPNGGFPGGLNGQFGIGAAINGGYPGMGGGGAFGGGQFGGGGAFGGGQFGGGGAFGGGQFGGGGAFGGGQFGGGGAFGGGQFGGGGAFGGGQFGGGGAFGGGGGAFAGAMNGGMGSYMNNPQLQQQMMQQQQQMLQQQMQYYQAQMQAQMQAVQRQQQIQQQAAQVEQEIASLQMRLRMLYTGGGSYGGGGGGFGGGGIQGGGAISGGIYIGAAAPTPGYPGGGGGGYNGGGFQSGSFPPPGGPPAGPVPAGGPGATVPGTAPRGGR